MLPDTDRKATLWFLAASATYFLVQIIQRVALGGRLEADEAEMLLLARDWAWGYGPQLPLYNWLQLLVFKAVGPNTLAVVLLKDFGLWLAGVGMWFGMRQAFDDRRAAAAAALSLAFLPNLIWEFQRATSHSIVLLVAICWTFWAWFWLMNRQDLRGWVILGVMMGLGGLSKWNYWAVPVGLAVASIGLWPQRVQVRDVIVSALVAGLIVAVPYYWAATHLSDSLASVHKFYAHEDVFPWTRGLDILAGNLLVGLALPALIGLPLWVFAARGKIGPAPMATKLLLRAAGLSVVVGAVLVVGFDVTNIQTRWLVPILIFACAGGFGWLGTGLSARAFRVVPMAAVVCAALTVIGMAQVRMGATGTRDLTPLTDLVARLQPDRIEGGYYLAGNLRMMYPDMDIRAEDSTQAHGDWPKRLLILGDLPSDAMVLDSGVLQLISPVKSSAPLSVNWYMVGPPG